MKHLPIIVLFFVTTLMAKAQEYKQSLDGIEWVKIESKAEITIRTHDSNELLIKSFGAHRAPERAKGLKLVVGDGTDNTDVGFYIIKEGNNLIAKNLKKEHKGRAEIYLPASQNISVTTNGTGQGDIIISGFKGEIEASAELNGGIRISDVSGPITANSLNGSIDIAFSKVNQDSPITIYSTNGALDITLPKDTPADLSLGTTNGEIYSNFELKFPEKKGLRAISTQKVKGAINNGGVQIQLKTTNGNIYLRKQ